ncbi:MAG: helix-turn-helix domain-containing protein [Chitinophagaceae bacterium]
MQDDIIIQISNKIKEERKNKNITIQSLANKAHVSKGLISQIENNRTVPSLLVLMNIVQSLNINVNEFFRDIKVNNKSKQKVIIKTSADYKAFEKEKALGFFYKRILTRNINEGPVDIVLLELKKGAKRNKVVKTDAYEYKYILKGKIEYVIGNNKHILNEGDSLFFDGRLGHHLSNIGNGNALLLIVYFFSD